MPSNRGVKYIDFGLNSLDKYWGKLVVPNVQAFRATPSSVSVFNAALSLWQLHDWVWHDRNPGQNSGGPTFNVYRNGLLRACPELGWLRDIADAGKHRGLGRLPQVQGAHPHVVGGVDNLLLLGVSGGGGRLTFFLVLNDDSKHEMGAVLNTVIGFWRTELATNNLPAP